MVEDEFGDRIKLMNAKVSALMKQAVDLREALKGDSESSELTRLSDVKIALQLAAIEIVGLETEEPDPDKLREIVAKHARALRDA